MGFLNKMERKFGRYAITGLMKYVVICYIIGYVLQYIAPNVIPYIILDPYRIFHHLEIWRLVSWVLLPPSRSNILFAIIMIVLYYQLGSTLEQAWGAFRFNVFIFGGVILTIIGAIVMYAVMALTNPMLAQFAFQTTGAITTNFINMTIFLAFALLFPDMRVMLYFIIPIKMKWMAIVYAALMIYNFVIYGTAGRVAIAASIVNFLLFFLASKRSPHAAFQQAKRRQQFKRYAGPNPAGSRQQSGSTAKQQTRVTRHKCAICGRTELDDPNLQFRFCSKCNGNYEYCQDHLFTHTHK